jgi:hypothetical protein
LFTGLESPVNRQAGKPALRQNANCIGELNALANLDLAAWNLAMKFRPTGPGFPTFLGGCLLAATA